MRDLQRPPMIISASYRTDIPAFHAAWFSARLAAGSCRVASPYGGRPSEVRLDREAVDAFVFWTRNVGPFAPVLAELARKRHPFVVQASVLGYPRALDRKVPAPERAIADLAAVATRYGKRVVVWRYDPIVITSLTGADWHAANFARLARSLRGLADEVVVSFAHIYRKTARNLGAAAARDGFTWRDPAPAEKRALIDRLAALAADHGMRLTLCTQPELVGPGAPAASCIDAARLSELAGRPIAARIKGNRPGCACAEARDIGAYDTCLQGCVYCYAVGSEAAARRRMAALDPAAPFLGPEPGTERHPQKT